MGLLGKILSGAISDGIEKAAKNLDQASDGLGTIFSEAMAQAREEAVREEACEEARRTQQEASVFTNWQEKLPVYPVWDVGGSHFSLEEDEPLNGHPLFRLSLLGPPLLLEMYTVKLLEAGFRAKGCDDPLDRSADTYYKIVDGVCYAWNRTDACMDSGLCTYFYVDDYKPEAEKTAAKGLFKKLF